MSEWVSELQNPVSILRGWLIGPGLGLMFELIKNKQIGFLSPEWQKVCPKWVRISISHPGDCISGGKGGKKPGKKGLSGLWGREECVSVFQLWDVYHQMMRHNIPSPWELQKQHFRGFTDWDFRLIREESQTKSVPKVKKVLHFLDNWEFFEFGGKNAAKRRRQHARIQWRLSSNERTHTRGRRTHSVSNWTDAQRGGGTHNVTQRTDTHIFIEGGEFWGHFQSNIPQFWLTIKEEECKYTI